MESKSLGYKVLLQIEVDGELKVLGGQTGATLSRNAQLVDITGRSDEGFTNSVPTILGWSISCDGFVVLGDVALSYIENSYNNSTPLKVTIKVDSEVNGETYSKIYFGDAILTNIDLGFAMDNAITYTLELLGISPLQNDVAIGEGLTELQRRTLVQLMELYTCCQGNQHDTLQERFESDFRATAYRPEQPK